jgi:ABC-2 type transport system ATP-binding protein
LSGLDVTTALLLRDLLLALAAQGRIIFYSSHVLEVVEKVCARVLILCKGRVVADGTIYELRDRLHEPSLEGVFSQLTQDARSHDTIEHILEVMQS